MPVSALVFTTATLLLLMNGGGGFAERVIPGSPRALTDWRWLARPPEGERKIISDAYGKQELTATDGGFSVLETDGPGVLDYLWATDAQATISIEVDGKPFWKGTFQEATQVGKDGKSGSLFPPPLVAVPSGGMCHLVAPIGFTKALRITTDKKTFPRFVSYRTFPAGTKVDLPSADPNSSYAKGLQAAADAWKAGGHAFIPKGSESPRTLSQDFVLQARSRATVLNLSGSGEITHLEWHFNPALQGTLREVVAEFFYNGAQEPSLRLPIVDLVGVPHPWTSGRWDAYYGDIAGGIVYPWYVNQPRFHYPELTLHLNLPVPYGKGLRIDLHNRSKDIRFTGFSEAVLEPLSASDAAKAGRLCGTRTITPVEPGTTPKPMIDVPGAGQLVALGLFTTGSASYPPAVRTSILSLQLDGKEPVVGHGLLPLWLQGTYGGPAATAIWHHPRYEDQYGGVMRHFLTDPIPFADKAVFAFTPGEDPRGAPTSATTVALWYRFGSAAYAAPTLPDNAETLPYSTLGSGGPPQKGASMYWFSEAEDLAPMAVANGGSALAIEDVDHNYHPSQGKYLQVLADQPGNFVDFVVPMPPTRYLSVGTVSLWGPNRAAFEMDVLSKDQSGVTPDFLQGDEFYRGRVLGHVPMKAPVFMGQSLRHRRDGGAEFSPPFLNPAPDGEGILRFICRSKEPTISSFMMCLDQVRIDAPPPPDAGVCEFETLPQPQTTLGVEAVLPKLGRLEWSGWGACQLHSPQGGKAAFHAFVPTAVSKPGALVIKGSLGPNQGKWQVRVNGSDKPFELTPGKDENAIVEWKIPVTGLSTPGPILLEFTCTEAGEKEPRMPQSPPGELVLDCWGVW